MKKKDNKVLISALKKLMRTTGKSVVNSIYRMPVYNEMVLTKTLKGSYENFEEGVLNSDSKIGIILGARGKGKTAIGLKLCENFATKTKKNFYSMGFSREKMPSWIQNVEDTSYIKNNSIVLVDEGGILFNSRESMSKANKLLSNLILISRHKNLTILFISQNSANLEINVLRQADFLILKPSSLLQKNFERKIIKEIYNDCEESFEEFKHIEGITFIYSDEYIGFIDNPLPSFWKESISKSFRNQ